ncbi:methyltransferase-like protein 25B [Apostichopus japonicus]|uniref:methyltransferase-like protein 25B n=1 Tax=Stichopus japonicus TaxID=307972 RepID=UPI003AB39194
MVAIRCSRQDKEKIQNYAQSLMLLVSKFRWLTDAYVVEFFVKDHWHALPSSWQEVLDGLKPHQVGSYLSGNKEVRHTTVWPLSLLAFCAATQSLTLNRFPGVAEYPNPVEKLPDQLDHCFKFHVKIKKRHEIQTLADIIHKTCKLSKVRRVVDVGGGLGHLTRLLSVGYGLKVMSIEAAGCHVNGAAKVDRKVEVLMEKRKKKGILDLPKLSASPLQPPVHIVCNINPDISVKEFVKIVNQHMSEEQDSEGLDQVEDKSEGSCTGDSFEGYESSEKDKSEGVKMNEVMKVTGDGSLSANKPVPPQSRLSPDNSKETHCREMTDKTSLHSSTEPILKLFSSNDQTAQVTNRNRKISARSQEVPAENERIVKVDQNREDDTNLTYSQRFLPDAESPDQSVFLSNDSTLCESEHLGRPDLADTDVNVLSQIKSTNSEGNAAFTLIGLHTCGDLGPTILRLFIRCREAKVLALVGCCYMKMQYVQPIKELDMMNFHEAGFPMSDWVKSLCGSPLTFEPLELACHFFDNYYQRLKDNDPNLIFQAYRAMLEILIQKEEPDLVKMHAGFIQIKKATGSVKKLHGMSFQCYANAVFRKLGLTFDPLTAHQLEELHRPHWGRLIIFHSLRLCLAPIVESLILIDRMLYLLENGVESQLTAVFDPFISPRNFLLQATKA